MTVSFAQPDCTYTKGSLAFTGTGLQFSSTGLVVRDAIAALKAAQPNTRVLLAVGGATYTNFAAINTRCIKDIVDDFGFDGVDLDYEPTNSNCKVGATKVTCATDAESVTVTTTLRNALPKGQYLLSTASWHVGCYGEGAFKASQPASAYTGVNLAMAKSVAGQQLDLINVMAYDAGNKASTGFDWSESYRAHRAVWPTQAIAIGVEIPPEAWGGNVITLPEVTTRANYAAEFAGGAQYGLMLWSLHKPGCPSAQQITSAACVAYNMAGCSSPLPQAQSTCSSTPPAAASPSPVPVGSSPSPPAPVPSSPAPPPSGSCATYAPAGGACGAATGGACCPSGQCCSQYGYCGLTTGHCGTGCQPLFGACSASPAPPPAASPSPASPPPPASSPAPQGGNGTVADYISAAQFESFFLHRNDPACASNGFYTYSAFLTAAAAFPSFGTSSTDVAANKRELAAFLAQISHETTGGWPTAPDGPYSWGLCWIIEGGKSPPIAPYCAATPEYPCAPGEFYYGRGPMQLSWNYNYIQAGVALGFDGLNNPELVGQDPVVAFKTAIWFWMTPQAPKPSCHDVMQGLWTPTAADTTAGRVAGFGLTTNIINGGLECNSGTPKAQELDRIGYFKRYADIYAVGYGDNLDCAKQQSF